MSPPFRVRSCSERNLDPGGRLGNAIRRPNLARDLYRYAEGDELGELLGLLDGLLDGVLDGLLDGVLDGLLDTLLDGLLDTLDELAAGACVMMTASIVSPSAVAAVTAVPIEEPKTLADTLPSSAE